ncbi:hypothetical protein ABFS82_14G138700 [Erythranthe guttata]
MSLLCFQTKSIKCCCSTHPPTPTPTPHSDGIFHPHRHSLFSMSTTPPLPPPPLISSAKSASFSKNLRSIGFGYSFAIALGFLVLFSSIVLAFYICCRSSAAARRRRHDLQIQNQNRRNRSGEHSIYLPSTIFVDESEPQNGVVGLDQAVINSYPKLVFAKRSGNWGNDSVCSICLCEYRESEVLRMLPDCKHCFHAMCVDAWLKLNASCPVCRNSPLPTPMSTPLQEVVPLSQYADGRRR